MPSPHMAGSSTLVVLSPPSSINIHFLPVMRGSLSPLRLNKKRLSGRFEWFLRDTDGGILQAIFQAHTFFPGVWKQVGETEREMCFYANNTYLPPGTALDGWLRERPAPGAAPVKDKPPPRCTGTAPPESPPATQM